MARALRAVLDPGHLTVVVNVGDDSERYGVHVAADPDTVLYTLADVVGPFGWGRTGDTTNLMAELELLGVDTSFTLGDADYALCLLRTLMMRDGATLTDVTTRLASSLGVTDVTILPATNDEVRTWIRNDQGTWLAFQEYFVDRQHKDIVTELAFHGSPAAEPSPGVIAAIDRADTVVIAPSNPALSIWPILAIEAIDDAVRRHTNRVAVSPLFGGKALKGPAAAVMRSLGLSPGTLGVMEAYHGLIDRLFVDVGDADDEALGETMNMAVIAEDTRLTGPDAGARFAGLLLESGIR
jgi:LPPG:FO 2-phospho-L-lactate transferase